LIDDGIAYLGSLNFTGNGTKNNYETRIRIEDRKAIKELVGEFDALFHNENYLEKELTEWGKELYLEQGN
jgi:phosphatidylserine/phosphatidylglycerophosphate/cardiolipin synthase-like enzyme